MPPSHLSTLERFGNLCMLLLLFFSLPAFQTLGLNFTLRVTFDFSESYKLSSGRSIWLPLFKSKVLQKCSYEMWVWFSPHSFTYIASYFPSPANTKYFIFNLAKLYLYLHGTFQVSEIGNKSKNLGKKRDLRTER